MPPEAPVTNAFFDIANLRCAGGIATPHSIASRSARLHGTSRDQNNLKPPTETPSLPTLTLVLPVWTLTPFSSAETLVSPAVTLVVPSAPTATLVSPDCTATPSPLTATLVSPACTL